MQNHLTRPWFLRQNRPMVHNLPTGAISVCQGTCVYRRTGERFGFEDGKTWMIEKEIEYVRRKRRGLVGNEEPPPWVNGIAPLLPK
jgi:hypothetical protein